MNFKSDKFLLFAMLISMCIWGMSSSSAKVLAYYGSAMSTAFIRFVFTFVALFILLKSFGVSLKISKKGFLSLLAAGLLMSGYGLLFFGGMQIGFAGAGAVLITTVNPLFAYLIGIIINKKMPEKREMIGLVIGIIAGCILLKVWLQFDLLLASGNLLFVAAGLTWALMSKFSSSSNKHGSPFAFSFWMHGICILSLMPIVDYGEVQHILMNGDQRYWLNILYFSTINSAGATTCFLYASSKIGAEKASGFVFMVPFTAAIAAWFFLGEAITTTMIVGGLLGVLAVLIMQGKIRLGKILQK